MNGIMLVGCAIIIFFLAYRIYGRWLLHTWGVDENAKTPAFKYNDGQDFTPASKFTVFSHQFSSITGAGPVTDVYKRQLQYMAPYSGVTMGEHFMYQGLSLIHIYQLKLFHE